MSGVIYERTPISGKVQADGAQVFTLSTSEALATRHQISPVRGTVTSGTLAVAVKPYGRTTFETLYDQYGVAVTLDMANQKTYVIEGRFIEMQFTPTSINGTYSIAATGWQ